MLRSLLPPRPRWLAALAGLCLAWTFAAPTTAQPFDALNDRLERLAADYPDLIRLQNMGTSHGGHALWLAELAADGDVAPADRPALLVVANLEGGYTGGSALAVGLLEALARRHATDADVQARLAAHTIYVLPRANPDGAARAYAAVRDGLHTNGRPHDDDNDGRLDEDGPDDLDGDGVISVMRVRDPDGAYFPDPDDPRVMRKADPAKGESGGWALYWEGRDDDGDGFYNEDATGGVDLNRNFQHAYPYYQRGAGPHMVSEPAARALMDWVIAHRNVAAILTFGASDNLITPPNSRGELPAAAPLDLFSWADASFADARTVGMMSKGGNQGFFGFGGGGQTGTDGRGRRPRAPETNINRSDVTYFETISKQYRDLTGITIAPPLRDPEGAFFQYGYFQYGVPSFSTPGWGLMAEAAEGDDAEARPRRDGDNGSADAKFAAWIDAHNPSGVLGWTAHTHPTLGAVEIGGFDPYAVYNPPAEMVDDLAARHADFALYLAGLLPHVAIAGTEVVDHGGGIYRVTAHVENTGFLPTSLAHGVTSRSVRPTMVQLSVAPDAILSGADKTAFFRALDGSGKRQTFEWVIQGQPGQRVELRVVSQKGGAVSTTLELR